LAQPKSAVRYDDRQAPVRRLEGMGDALILT
jgi:hypothetical protein